MGFISYLYSFISQRWLNPNKSGTKRLMNGLGTVLDQYNDMVNSVKNESRVSTAVDSIPIREAVYGIKTDPSLSLDVRRGNILARMRERGGPIIKEDLISSVKAAYGIDINILHDYNNYVVTIQILSVIGPPDSLSQMQAYIEQACRAHIGKNYAFRYLRVKEIHNVMTINQLNSTPINHFQGGVN